MPVAALFEVLAKNKRDRVNVHGGTGVRASGLSMCRGCWEGRLAAAVLAELEAFPCDLEIKMQM